MSRLKFLLLAFIYASMQMSYAATEVSEAMYGYLTKYQGEVYASSNWYINASVISEKIGTVTLEDLSDSKFELDGNKLMLTLKLEGIRVEVATIDESIIASLTEGERAIVQTQNTMKLTLVAQKSRPSFRLGGECGISSCDYRPGIELKHMYLLELSLNDGQVVCVNQGYQSERAKFYSGKCSIKN